MGNAVGNSRCMLPALAMVTAVASLCFSANHEVTFPQRVATAANTALRLREKQLVTQLFPDVRKLYKDLGEGVPDQPETIDQLLRPLFRVVNNIK